MFYSFPSGAFFLFVFIGYNPCFTIQPMLHNLGVPRDIYRGCYT